LFELRHCEQLVGATAKQTTEYNAYIVQQQAQHQVLKKQQLDSLLAQDQTIPIHFIAGVS
jgi:hypothetical protein